VTSLLEIAALLLVFDSRNLLSATLKFEECFDFASLDRWHANSRILAVIDKQNLVKRDLITLGVLTGDLLDLDDIADGDLVLLASCFDDCEFHIRTYYQKVEKMQ